MATMTTVGYGDITPTNTPEITCAGRGLAESEHTMDFTKSHYIMVLGVGVWHLGRMCGHRPISQQTNKQLCAGAVLEFTLSQSVSQSDRQTHRQTLGRTTAILGSLSPV